MHVSEIMLQMVTEDMLAHIENVLLVADDGQVALLVKLRQLDAVTSQVDYVTRIGLALLGCIGGGPAEQPPEAWNPTIEALAIAMAARAEPAAIRGEALDHATTSA
jgi:hypothetical protein